MISYYAIAQINQNMRFTNNAESPTKIRPIPACLKIVNPFLYFPSSPAAVTIWKPPRRRMINEIKPRNPSIRLTAFLIVSIKGADAQPVEAVLPPPAT